MIRLARQAAAGCVALLMFATPSLASTGMASYYKMGKRTANGEAYNPHGLTAAHRNLPFGTRLKVTNLANGRSVLVRVNDRGPFIRGRVLDLSFGAAKIIGMTGRGIARINFEVLR